MVKKVIVKANIYDEKMKQKAMKVVSELDGIQSISVDKETGKIALIGEMDPIDVVNKLNSYNKWPCRNWLHASLESVGPKEEKKKEVKKEAKKEKTTEEKMEYYEDIFKHYQFIYPNPTQICYAQSIEEDPNACVIS
ncbi:hypothetical protein ZOSMA_10G01040 [Zostera marina]|uniref:HMA domain-containing protein n=1 Tax=Zostera marina TaxID=29655 RepID=A0A0K9Q3I8_ZOSMR|nr:hypothetical protein ZOSMA_10G01040 [Zostera marina]